MNSYQVPLLASYQTMIRGTIALMMVLAAISGCGQPAKPTMVGEIDRETKIPADATKITPATDDTPPQIDSTEYTQPVPVPGEVNTAGAEDSSMKAFE